MKLLLAALFSIVAQAASDDVARRLVEVLNSPDRHYFGSPVTFDAKDAPLPDVLRLIGERSGLNLVWDDDVEALKVSLAVKDVPWDQLLDLVVAQRNLKVLVHGNVIELLTSERFLKRLEQKKKELGASAEPTQLAVLPVAFSDARGMEHLLRVLLTTDEKTPRK